MLDKYIVKTLNIMSGQEQTQMIAEEMQKAVRKLDSQRRKFVTYFSLLLATLFSLLGVLFSLYGIINEDHFGSKRFAKQDIQAKIITTVRHGGTLESVKHIYAARIYKNYDITDLLRSSSNEYYYEPTSLSFILNDILVEAYQRDLYKDSVYIASLSRMLIEHERKNPFDDLEDSQRATFENILIKLGDNYEIIQSDVSKLANEVNNQNKLVYKYLNKSTQSYVISIIALIVTIIALGYQIYQTKKFNDLIKIPVAELDKI